MPLLSESLLRFLQYFIKHPPQIKQIHSLIIAAGHLRPPPPAFPWTATLLYNALIRAYLNIQLPRTALLLFTHMLSHGTHPNAHTFSSLIKAATTYHRTPSPFGKPLHAQALKRGGVTGDPFVQTSFLNLYEQGGCLSSARKVFDEMPEPCVVSCNAMLNRLCKNGDMGSAVWFFKRMPVRDVFSWTSVVNGYVTNGCFDGAIGCFRRMMAHGRFGHCLVKPNEATFVSVLSACANSDGVGRLFRGKQIHGYIIKNEAHVTAFVGTALISLYGKTGGLRYATRVFKNMAKREVCTWNAMIGTLASNAKELLALEMFEKMAAEGCRPNGLTFAALLAACARAKSWNRA